MSLRLLEKEVKIYDHCKSHRPYANTNSSKVKIELYNITTECIITTANESSQKSVLCRPSSIEMLQNKTNEDKGIIIFQGNQFNLGVILDYSWKIEDKLQIPKGKLENTNIKALFIENDFQEFCNIINITGTTDTPDKNEYKRKLYFFKAHNELICPVYLETKPFKYEGDKLYVITFCTFIETFMNNLTEKNATEQLIIVDKNKEILGISKIKEDKKCDYHEATLVSEVPILKTKGLFELANENEMVLKVEKYESKSSNKTTTFTALKIDKKFVNYDVVLVANVKQNHEMESHQETALVNSSFTYYVPDEKIFKDLYSYYPAQYGDEELVSMDITRNSTLNESVEVLNHKESNHDVRKYNSIYLLVLIFLVYIGKHIIQLRIHFSII